LPVKEALVNTSQVLHEVRDRVALLTLNHPEKRNALSRGLLTNLRDHLGRIAEDHGVRVVILGATGPVFSSGHDLRELTAGDEGEYTSLFALCTEVMEAFPKLPQPVIAQVQGMATAAGCQLATSCDLVVASEEASFATPGVKIGLFCSTPAVALCRAVPVKKALEMLFTGEPISAREAERVGLVNHVVPADRLAEETMQLALQISRASRTTLALGKRAFYEQLPLDRSRAYAVAERTMVANALTDDCREGVRAFLEKRPARWED
jgi:enoyl-CoA hydratase/carnithine racemase